MAEASPAGYRDKLPPQSIEAEMAVLGAVLLDNNAYSIATESITTDSFYKKAHKDLFEAMTSLSKRGEAIDIITLTEELKKLGTYQTVGGAAYLTAVVDNVHTAANVEYYANIVLQKYIMRRLITISNQIARIPGEHPVEVDKRKVRKISLHHASWSRILTEGEDESYPLIPVRASSQC